LIRLFTPQQTELSLAEMVAQAGLNYSTTYRIIQALVQEGLLAQNPANKKYRLGYGLIKFGELAKQSNYLIQAATPHVTKLAAEWGETTIVDVLNPSLEVVKALSIPSTYRIGANLADERPATLNNTAAGKVLLAHATPHKIEKFLSRKLVAFTDKTLTDPDQLRDELERVRRQGYATNIDEIEIGYVAVAVPVRDATGFVIAALSVGGPSSRLTAETLPGLIESVLRTASAISMDLGCNVDAYYPTSLEQVPRR
jgi:DNA-binding IclR family transcriptional regulator